MRIQLISDLHLETNLDFQFELAPDADVLILGGDIGSYQKGSRLQRPTFGLERFSPNKQGGKWPVVMFLPGNHEYDDLEFDEADRAMRQVCEDLGIVWLEKEVVVIGTTRFVGTTLWTDYSALELPTLSLAKQLLAREKAFRAANFYLRRNTSRIDGEPLLAEDMRRIGLECQAWLQQALATPFDGTTVVVTHFAPSLKSADPRYGLTPGTAGFCNSIDEMFVDADVWMHGHLHCANDYVVETPTPAGIRRCRVVANPLGYESKGEQKAFVPRFIVDVP
ncbi:MAG: metallophosphoesterase [Rhizobacter sp.]|nr:metallophosphoesterase [Rhizobacter sp.]